MSGKTKSRLSLSPLKSDGFLLSLAWVTHNTCHALALVLLDRQHATAQCYPLFLYS